MEELLQNRKRPPMNQVQFDEKYVYNRKTKSNNTKKLQLKHFRRFYSPFLNIREFLFSLFPIIGWLREYDFARDLGEDIIGGFTVGIMHVPQGIAYAVLAGQQPIVGLYTSIIPAFIYMIFGTSKHASIGSFAVLSLMTGICVEREIMAADNPTPIEISCAIVFTIGVIQFLMGLLNLQVLMTYMSDQVVAGFTTGASIHVLVSQFKDLFGLTHLPKNSGPGYIVKNVYDIITNVLDSNWMCCAIGFTTIIILDVGKEYITPVFKKRTSLNVPIPWELVVVIASTIFCASLDAKTNYGVRIVGEIPTGLPSIDIPRFDLIPRIYQDAISIAVVIVAVHLSLSKMLAKRKNYEIDPGQEFLALSITSIGSSFFPVYPVSCALGRTMVGVESGIVSQMATVFSCLFVASITLFFGQFLENLPMCVLSAIIIVALKGMLRKIGDLRALWRVSKIDFSIWLVAFFATVIVDVSEGLLIAVLYALFTTILREQYPKWHILANVGDTSEFLDNTRYQETVYFKGICLFRFDAPLLFHNVECFKRCADKAYEKWRKSHEFYVLEKSDQILLDVGKPCLSQHFIVDCSGFTSIDLMGVNALKEIFSDMRKRGILVYFANTKAPLRDMFEKSDFYQIIGKENLYPSLEDATTIAKQRQVELGFTSKSHTAKKYTEEVELSGVVIY